MKVTVDVKNAQATEETRGSDMVAEGMMEVHTAHATSTPVMETSKALTVNKSSRKDQASHQAKSKWNYVIYLDGRRKKQPS